MAIEPEQIQQIYGVTDKSISQHLKTWLKSENITVVGITGEGTSREITSNWGMPFQGESLGGLFQKFGAGHGGYRGVVGKIGDALSSSPGQGLTQVYGDFNVGNLQYATFQVWEGTMPHVFNLVLKFFAFSDAKKEVHLALSTLEQWASPEFSMASVGARIPPLISLNIGRMAIFTDCIIKTIQITLDKPKTRDGYMSQAEVNLSVERIMVTNKSVIPQTFSV